MSYLWQEFNIKTFEAETLVFRDGVFCEDLSDYESMNFEPESNSINITKTPKLPIRQPESQASSGILPLH